MLSRGLTAVGRNAPDTPQEISSPSLSLGFIAVGGEPPDTPRKISSPSLSLGFVKRTVALSCLVLLASACALRGPAKSSGSHDGALLPDVRVASGRPPVVLVSREGDPATAIAIAVTTAGIGWTDASSDDPEPATALAGLVESRLRARSVDAVVTPSWDGVRASTLAANDLEASRLADTLRDALVAPATEADLLAARRKLAALGQRPLRDRALARWSRCVGEPRSLPERAGKDYADVDLARLERWRTSALGLGRVAVAVTGPSSAAEAVASAILRGPAWKTGASITRSADPGEPAIDVFEAGGDVASVPTLHMTLDVGTSSAAVTTAEALGDAHGPLAARLSELDLPFRVREVTGAAHARGGCVGVVLEAAPTTQAASAGGADLAARVADAVALVRLEASVFLAETGSSRDGRVLSRRSGDAREAAERAAWWALVDKVGPPKSGAGSVALAVPSRRGAKDAAVEPTREALASAVTRAAAAWDKPVVEARSRVEAGQGEAWVLVGSPCGTDGETDADSGLTALFAAAAAEATRTSTDVRVEPWVAADGAGILVHGPALAGEAPAAHARRLADIAARSFAAEPISSSALGRARADLLRRDARGDGAALSVLASALAPRHPSWVVPWGSSEPLARSADSSVVLRAQSLRTGPVRIAVLASSDASQADAAVRAADRWVARRTSETRACTAPAAAQPPQPGTYAATPRPGAIPEAYLAFPFSPGDETAHAAAMILVAALSDGDGALLDKALGGPSPLAREASARVLGWPRAPALVVRVVAAQASLDAAVMQARALIDRVHKAGLASPDFERATAARARAALATSLDPRARIVATWRGDAVPAAPTTRTTAEDVRAFAQKYLAEDAMVVVASRPARPPAAP